MNKDPLGLDRALA